MIYFCSVVCVVTLSHPFVDVPFLVLFANISVPAKVTYRSGVRGSNHCIAVDQGHVTLTQALCSLHSRLLPQSHVD